MAAGSGVQVVPEEISIRVDRGNSLGAGANVYQRVSGWRRDDAVEERKDIELHQLQAPVRVEVSQDTKACGQDVVIKNARLCRGNRGCGRAVEPWNQSQRREVGDDEVGGAGIDQALDVIRLIDSRIDHVVR